LAARSDIVPADWADRLFFGWTGRLDFVSFCGCKKIQGGKNLKHCACQVHVVPSTSQQLVTVVSCDSPNNNLYHQRVIEANRRDTSHAINVDNIRVSSEPPSRRPSASTSVNEVVDIDSHETSHSSIAEALQNLVNMF
jgi:hypothetical protein